MTQDRKQDLFDKDRWKDDQIHNDDDNDNGDDGDDDKNKNRGKTMKKVSLTKTDDI